MSDQDAFERILASLYDAMLDDAHWPATSALIDAACGTRGNCLLVGEGPQDAVQAHFLGAYYRGGAAKTWNASTSTSTIPSTNACRACCTCRQPPGPHHRAVHPRGVADLADLQRIFASGRWPEWLECPPGRAGWLPPRLGLRRPRRPAVTGHPAACTDYRAPPAYPAIYPRPPGAGQRRSAGRIRDRAPRHLPDGGHLPRPARAGRGGQ